MRVYLLILLVATAVTWLAVPLVRRLARAAGAITPVRDRDVHSVPIPRLGGVAMLLGVAVALLVAMREPFTAQIIYWGSPVWGVFWGGLVVGVVGFIDDVWGLDWFTKLLGQIVASLIMALMGVQLVTIPIAGLTIISPRASLVLTVLFAVACMNAVNFVDGLDGLAAGMIGIGALGLFGYAYGIVRSNNPLDFSSAACVILAACVGVCLGFLAHNFHPATIFMGDTGAMILGLMVAGATITLTGQVDPSVLSARAVIPVVIPIALPFATLLFPFVDMISSVVRRLRHGQSPFQADGLHIHHRILQAAAFSQRKAVGTLYVWTAAVVVPSIALLYLRFYEVLVLLVLALLAVIITTWKWLPGIGYRIAQRYPWLSFIDEGTRKAKRAEKVTSKNRLPVPPVFNSKESSDV